MRTVQEETFSAIEVDSNSTGVLSVVPAIYALTLEQRVRELEQDLIMARNTITEQLSRLSIASKDAEDNASELSAVESALGFRDFLDSKGVFQNCHQKSLERIRDLIAKEGELGDIRSSLSDQQRVNAELKQSFEAQRNNYLKLYEAVMGEGSVTCEFHDIESVARNHREERDQLKQQVASSEYTGNLLAIIHCDGGHYRDEHGNKKATDDAIEIFGKLKQQLEEVLAYVQQLKEGLSASDAAFFQCKQELLELTLQESRLRKALEDAISVLELDFDYRPDDADGSRWTEIKQALSHPPSLALKDWVEFVNLVKTYLVRPSIDGSPVRIEIRKQMIDKAHQLLQSVGEKV